MVRPIAIVLALSSVSCGAPTPAPDPLASASCGLETTARELAAAGHLERARRALGATRRACPEGAQRQWDLELTVLAELGRWADLVTLEKQVRASALAGEEPIARALRRAAELRNAHLARPHDGTAAWQAMLRTQEEARAARQRGELAGAMKLFEKAWSEWRPHGRPLIEAGLLALELDDAAGAQRLFDRGLAELEASTGAALTLDTRPNIEGGVHVATVHGHTLDALGKRGTLLSVFDRSTGAELLRLPTEHQGASSADERWILTNSRSGAHLWDAAAGRYALTFEQPCNDPVFSADGAQLACAYDDRIVLRHTSTGRVLHTLGPGQRFFFTPDSATFVNVPDRDRIQLWSTNDGTLRAELVTVGTSHRATALSSDGRWLATSRDDDTRVQIFEVASGAEVAQLVGHQSVADALAFSPDDSRLASASREETLEWEVTTGRLLHQLPSCQGPVAYAPTGSRLACGSLSVWNTESCAAEAAVHAWGGELHTLAFTTSGERLLVHRRELQRGSLEIRDAQSLAVVDAGVSLQTASFSELAHARDGALLVGATTQRHGAGSSLWRWDLEHGTLLRPLEVSGGVTGLRLSHDGHWVGVITNDHQLRVLDARTGAAVATFAADSFAGGFAFSADDSEVRLLHRGALETWSIETARLETKALLGTPNVPPPRLVSSDGRRLYTLSRTALEVHDAASQQLLAQHPLASDALSGARLVEAPNGTHVAVLQQNAATILVTLADGATAPIAAPEMQDPRLSALAFSADGQWLAVGSEGAFLTNRETGSWHGRKSASAEEGRRCQDAQDLDATHPRDDVSGCPSETGERAAPAVRLPPCWYGPLLGADAEDGVVSLAIAGNSRLIASFESGLLRVWRIADRRLEASVHPIVGHDAAIVIGARGDGSPAVDVMGRAPLAAEAGMRCRVGPHVLPFAACRSRVLVPGLFAKLLHGEPLGHGAPPRRAKPSPAARSPKPPAIARERAQCRPADQVLAWWNEIVPADRASTDDDIVWPRLTPAQTKAQVGPIADEVVRHLWSRDYAALAKLVHPRGLRLEHAQTLSQAQVAAIASDRRGYRFDDDACGASSLHRLASVFDDRIHGRAHQGGRNYSTPRSVGYSRVAPFGLNFAFTTASISHEHPGLPFVHLAVSEAEFERGHRASLVLVFDEHQSAYRLAALFVVEEDNCG